MEYPKRPEQHIIEDKSFKILSNALPNDWLIREATKKDYGIDIYIEICQNGSLTGNMFVAQLKGTKYIKIHHNSNEDYVSCSGIKNSTLNYWYSLPIPVIMFYIDITTDDIYFENIKKFIRQNYNDFLQKKLHTIKMPIIQKFNKSDDLKYNIVLNGAFILMTYLIEIRRERFEFLVNDFFANFDNRLELLVEHDNRDCFLPIEQNEPDYIAIFNTHISLTFLCDYLGINHCIPSLREILESGKNMFCGKDFYGEFYEQQIADFAQKAFPIMREVANKLHNLFSHKERYYWENNNGLLMSLIRSNFFNKSLKKYDFMFKNSPINKA
jgi:hypothetical protein